MSFPAACLPITSLQGGVLPYRLCQPRFPTPTPTSQPSYPYSCPPPPPPPHAVIDCGDPGVPANGGRSFSSTLFNTVVNYSCNEGYELFGSQRRTCQVNEQWSQSLPECRSKLTANAMSVVLLLLLIMMA